MKLKPDCSTRLRKRARAWAVPILAAAALLTAASGPVSAADLLGTGAAAYDAGDYGEAAHIWRPLAEEGDAMAQFNMGLLHETGRGVSEDPAQAAAWYERAALQGVPQAQYNLAVLHQAGRGVPQDGEEALYWLEVAARHSEGAAQEQAAEDALKLADALSPEEAEAARARARAFAPRPEDVPARAGDTTLILSQHQVETLQRRLSAHGYDVGPVDGVPGAQTRSAVRRYLADRGHAWPDGEHLSQRLLDLVREP